MTTTVADEDELSIQNLKKKKTHFFGCPVISSME